MPEVYTKQKSQLMAETAAETVAELKANRIRAKTRERYKKQVQHLVKLLRKAGKGKHVKKDSNGDDTVNIDAAVFGSGDFILELFATMTKNSKMLSQKTYEGYASSIAMLFSDVGRAMPDAYTKQKSQWMAGLKRKQAREKEAGT